MVFTFYIVSAHGIQTGLVEIRGVGTGGAGGPGPPSLGSALFLVAKCPFFPGKKFIKIAFFSQSALLKTSIYVISGKMLKFWGKMSYIMKIFSYFRKIFFVFRKNGMSGKFFWPHKWYTDRNFFGDGGGGGGRSPKKIKLSALFFFEKFPSEPGPPNFSKLPMPLVEIVMYLFPISQAPMRIAWNIIAEISQHVVKQTGVDFLLCSCKGVSFWQSTIKVPY